MTLPFQFKQFSVSDADCGMKLSSDAVLLGAYAKPPASGRILDIGCGCGVLSLMMAQQSKDAFIAAVEIDEMAARQAQENFSNSKWAGRIQVYHESIQNFTEKAQPSYDCIISNPPYFHNQLKSDNSTIAQSKHTVELNYQDLCLCVSRLLTDSGWFWVILPATERMSLIHTALQNGLFCKKMLSIHDREGKSPVRNIFCLGKEIVMEARWDELTVKGAHDEYTQEYIELTKEFYLEF